MKRLRWLVLVAAALTTQCAKPVPPPKPEWAFDASLAFTPEAQALLKDDGSMVIDVYYYGPIAPGSKQQPDSIGRVRLGDDLFDTNVANPHVHVTGIGVDQSLLGDVVNREVHLLITAYSTKQRDPDSQPFVECSAYIGTTTMARTVPPVITCGKYKP